MIPKEELQLARKQLSDQVEALAAGPQKDAARKQLEEMSDGAISAMVEQQRGVQAKQPQKGIFRMIVDGDVPSKKIDENKEAIAVVSVRPVSRGHVLIIPKKAANDSKVLPASALSLAKKTASKMVSKLKAEGTEIQTSSAFGEVIVNVIPVYDKPVNVNSPPYEAKDEELQEIYDLLRGVKKAKKEKIKVRRKENSGEPVLKLPRRIP